MEIIYKRSNADRKKEFLIETQIVNNSDNIYVLKKASCSEAKPHLNAIYENYFKFTPFENVFINKTNFEGENLLFEYINGITFEELILERTNKADKEQFYNLIKKYIQIIKNISKVQKGKFIPEKPFIKIFGFYKSNIEIEYCTTSNIDLLFSNIIIDNQNNYHIIDYEWVFDFPIPLNYIVFRSIFAFWSSNKTKLKDFISEKELYKICNISNSEIKSFYKMENNFQYYVTGHKNKEDLIKILKRELKYAF